MLSFPDETSLFKGMEAIRAGNDTEAVGFVQHVAHRLELHFRVSNDRFTTDLIDHPASSWHSHPGMNLPEIPFNPDDVEMLPQSLRIHANRLLQIASVLDQISPKKISAVDILNVAYFQRDDDYISMPPGHVLHLTQSAALPTAPTSQLSGRLREIWRESLKHAVAEVDELDLQAIGAIAKLDYLAKGFDLLQEILGKFGIAQMTENNFLEVLTQLGIPYRYLSVK